MGSAFFDWNENRTRAAFLLADGMTQREVAKELHITDRAIRKWLAHPEFSAEVDRLSLMTGIASRAERLRLAKKVLRQKIRRGVLVTDRDALEWLKFAQSETDGVKLDLGKIAAAFGADETPLADSGPIGRGSPTESDSIN